MTGAMLSSLLPLRAQVAATPAPSAPEKSEEEVLVLNPFVVDASEDEGYQATSTLAGTRLRTNLSDVGSAISVITAEMLTDLGAVNNETVLNYAVNTEVGGPRGNFTGGVAANTERYQEQALFTNPNGNTRVRGLTNADNTRNYFLTDIPWDGYTVERVDLQRGPNAILFGLGSPAGVVNATTNDAQFRNFGKFEFTFDKFSSQRYVLDYNRNLVPGQAALRVTLLRNDQQFRQDPAFQLDERVYVAAKIKPNVFNRNGTTFEVTGNYEHGNIDSNRPRVVTPGDLFSGYWDPTSKGGTNRQVFDNFATAVDDTPYLGGGGLGDVVALGNSQGNVAWLKGAHDAYRAIKPDGTYSDVRANQEFVGAFPDGNINRVGIELFPTFANASGLPFADFGAYSPKTITDPSIFDFYNKLLDGDNKREWTDWDVFQVNLTNTFLSGSLGYELAYFNQSLERGQWSVLGWDNTIYMDVNSANNLGVPNPDVGRAYVQVENRDFGNGSQSSDRDAARATVFGEYDFKKHHGTNFWTRLFGTQRVTGVASEENQKTDARSYRIGDLDPNTKKMFAPNGTIEGAESIGSGFRYYLSGDVRGQGSAAGSHLSNIGGPVFNTWGGPVSVRYFDNTWIAGAGVDPNAPWANPDRPDGTFKQSQNPANFKGWSDASGHFVSIFTKDKVLDMTAQDYLTSVGTLNEFNVKSTVGVWQGYFWDSSIIGTYGYRKDKAHNYLYVTGDRQGNGRTDTKSADLRPATYNFANEDASVQDIETTTRNWSVAAHLNRLLGKHDFLPVNVSLYYNEGENFQPLAGRIDAFSQPLPPPAGSTVDKSILIATKDNKYSLRVTQYETEVLNANSTGSVGNMWALEQILFITSNGARAWRRGEGDSAVYTSRGGDYNQLQSTILPAWFQFEKDFKAAFPEFVNAWMKPNSGESATAWATDSNANINAGAPAGFSFTEDSHSEGYEFEFVANPTKNWRIALNASKTEATRQNVPGPAFKEAAAYLANALETTPAGLVPYQWDPNDAINGAARNNYAWLTFKPSYLSNAALNGQSALEVRQWRFNALTNYTFSEGSLRGLGVGGGVRYEDKGVVGYAPMKTAEGDNAINLSAPYYTPSNTTVDLWVSYERRLSKKINWRIQLNVYNAFGENELVPISASVDFEALGNQAITPSTVIPMRASGYTIREGLSWQLSNTFEF